MMWKEIVNLIALLFSKTLSVMIKNPIKEKKEYNDVSQKKHTPDNPDDIFSNSDFD